MPASSARVPLTRLRRDLARLRRRRAAVRLGTAFTTAGVVLLVALAAAFAIDYLADLRPLQRAVVLLAVAFAGGWVASGVVGPWLGMRETATDLALRIGRRRGLDTDLVAALQFQSPEAAAWGSPELERAVIRRIDEASRELDLFEDFSWRPLPGRAALLCGAIAAVAVPAVLSPRYAAAFLERLTLADVPYPTRTVITAVVLNGTAIDLTDRAPLRAPAGAPLTFAATVAGVRPAAGVVVLESAGGGRTELPLSVGATGDGAPPSPPAAAGGAARAREQLAEGVAPAPLTPDPSPQGEGDRRRSPASSPAAAPATAAPTTAAPTTAAPTSAVARREPRPPGDAPAYAGVLDALVEPVAFTVRVGDAVTPPRRIELVPRPTVTLDLKPTPPEYARSNAPAPPPPGVRTAFVLEGSDVAVVVRAGNKPLDRVTLAVTRGRGGDGETGRPAGTTTGSLSPPPPLSPSPSPRSAETYPLTPSSDRRTWTLSPAGTPLGNVREPVAFTISVVDADGLSPAEPLTGSVRLRADRPPRVAAAAVVRRVLPTARPELSYGASDDFGVKEVRAKVTVNRADGTSDESVVPLPARREAASDVQGRSALDLSPFGLNKGDTVVVTVEAEDARGDRPGETAAAEPLTFEVTDREGLLASLLEADEEGAERLDAIIRRELGIGGER